MGDAQRWLRRIYVSEAVSNIGSRLTTVALSYQLYRQTGRGADLGWFYLMITIPGVIFSNSFGHLADRFARKWLLVFADGTRAAILLIMAFVVPLDAVTLLLPLVFLSQVFRTLYDVAVIPLLSDLTRDEALLTKATANLKAIYSVSLLLGLGLGGFVAAFLRPQYIFMIDAATFIFSALLIRSISLPEARAPGYGEILGAMFSGRDPSRWFHLIRDGFRLVKQHEYRKTVIILEVLRDLGYGFFNPLLSLWPQALFAAVPNSLGVSLGMRGVGSIAGSLFMSRCVSEESSKKKLFFLLCVSMALAELVATSLAFASSRFVVYVGCSLVAAFFMNAFEVTTFVKYISSARENEKGAMMGFFRFSMHSALTLGMGVYVLVADRLPVRVLPVIALALLGVALLTILIQRESFRSA